MSKSVGQVPSMGQATFSPPFRRLQPAEFTLYLVGRDGFEPSTNWLKASLSPNHIALFLNNFVTFRVPFDLFESGLNPTGGVVRNSEWDSFQ